MENLMPTDTTVNSVSPVPCESLGKVCLHISVGPFRLPHIFHILEVDPMWHMLLGRPWIHDHRCVPSSWHQCIKAAPSKGGQIRVRGLRNPFALEEAHFADAAFFMEGNVLKLAREQPSSHVYPDTVDLPDFIKPTANYPPPKPLKVAKLHKLSVPSAPAISPGPEASLVPLKVTVHSGQPKGKAKEVSHIQEAQSQEEKERIAAEDTAMVLGQWEMPVTNFCDKVITLDPCPVIYFEEQEDISFDEFEVITLEPQEPHMLESFPYRISNESEG